MRFHYTETSMILTKTLGAALSLAATLLTAGAFAQADFPSRPITIIVPYGPGSATDNTARPIAQALTK